MEKLLKFLKDEEGIVAIEYALIALLIAVAIVGTVTALGGQLNTVFTSIKNSLSAAS
jgi:pilus assembly protein Flp/PilA